MVFEESFEQIRCNSDGAHSLRDKATSQMSRLIKGLPNLSPPIRGSEKSFAKSPMLAVLSENAAPAFLTHKLPPAFLHLTLLAQTPSPSEKIFQHLPLPPYGRGDLQSFFGGRRRSLENGPGSPLMLLHGFSAFVSRDDSHVFHALTMCYP